MARHTIFQITCTILVAGVLSLSGARAEDVDVVPGPQASPELSPDDCWKQWLSKEGMKEGANFASDGSFRYVAKAQDVVKASIGSKSWVAARKVAFSEADLQARKQFANYWESELSSDQELRMLKSGGDEISPASDNSGALSLADKENTLTGLALDNEISKFDPDWDGNGKTDEQRRAEAVRLQSKFKQYIADRVAVDLLGVVVVAQCEGPASVDGTVTAGKYEVLVGIMWSPKLAYRALGMLNPNIKPPLGSDRIALKERFADFEKRNPDWLLTTLGARVWTDENGEMIIVGFGASSASTLKSADKQHAILYAQNEIARFVGESLEASGVLNDQFAYRQLASGTEQVFDENRYEEGIKARAKEINLRGAYEVASWRGKHPVSGVGMEVVAYAWTPRSRDAAAAGLEFLKPTAATTSEDGVATAIETQVRAGADSDVSDY